MAIDLLGTYDSFFGLDWLDESPQLVRLGDNLSRAASVYGVKSSLTVGDEADWTGAAISAGGLIPGPIGFAYSLLGVIKDSAR